MDLQQALRQRRMVRSFDGTILSESLVTGIFADSLQVPSAGNTRATSWIVLVGEDETAQYFAAATDERWRETSTRYPGLSRASALGICLADPSAYLNRYRDNDKDKSGLGLDTDSWPIPYWIGDAGAAAFAALLLCEGEGLDACFLGAFRGQDALKNQFDIPTELQIYGAVLMGHADGNDHRSRSLDRPGATRSERIHRGVFRRPENQ